MTALQGLWSSAHAPVVFATPIDQRLGFARLTNQNAFVERFNRSFRDEVLNANLFNSVDQAQEAADDWVQDYNEFRPHESLGDVAPMEFMPRKFVKEISSFKLST